MSRHLLDRLLDLEDHDTPGDTLEARSAIDGAHLASLAAASADDVRRAVDEASKAFLKWRLVPAPRRGELVRLIGLKLRERRADLASLVTLEVGKITQEALGEVQEMIDVCDFAVGLSRQLHGLTIASERPGHRMMEQWHPLGPVGVITAFNFPVAVWAWNAMLALVCGDPVVWKPSEKATLCAVAVHDLVSQVVKEFPDAPPGLLSLLIGDSAAVGEPLAASEKLPLISATGSVRMGRAVGQVVAKRLGRSLLELGGNNGMILAPSADLELAIRAIAFAAAGTAGQRCTTLRRLIVHDSLYGDVVRRLSHVFAQLPVGDPRDPKTLVGPLIDEEAGESMGRALMLARTHGAAVHGGDRVTGGDVPRGGCYVRPALVEARPDLAIVREETFAPILYVLPYRTLDEAVAIHNDVPQGRETLKALKALYILFFLIKLKTLEAI